MKQDYYIGLDMGTESVGWAVTDVDYNLVKKRGQDYWGVYLFDEAKTAQGRRASRTNRRRLARVRHRLNLLQELFDSEISAKDFVFFTDLKTANILMRTSLKLRGENFFCSTTRTSETRSTIKIILRFFI